jgi:hypothetical protein
VLVTFPQDHDRPTKILKRLPVGSNVALVLHHNYDVEAIPKERALDKHNVTMLFLGEHVERSAREILYNIGLNLPTAHIYPVMQWRYSCARWEQTHEVSTVQVLI